MRGFTLIELLIVIIIIGILSTLGVTQYGGYKEQALDKEAVANLKLIAAAERIYYMEQGSYYPPSSSEPGLSNINANLRLFLSENNWDYEVWSTGCGQATRANRSWHLTISDGDGEPDTGAGCP